MRKSTIVCLLIFICGGALANIISQKAHPRTGGRIRDTRSQKGMILIANAQDKVLMAEIMEPIEKLACSLHIAIEGCSVPDANPNASADLLKAKSASAVVYLLDKQSKPIMLIAPDDRWAAVNVCKLGDENIIWRTQVEVVRAIIFLCGGIASQYPDPLTRPITNVKLLDMVPEIQPPVDVLQRMYPYLKALGITTYSEVTYRRACQEGWAPAPTNDFQKAIWEKVHSAPEKPMKITYDKDKKKPVVK